MKTLAANFISGSLEPRSCLFYSGLYSEKTNGAYAVMACQRLALLEFIRNSKKW